jgi:hypothetical protein
LHRKIVRQVQALHEGPQRQALQRERAQHHPESAEHDQVPVHEVDRQCQCGGQRDDAAHATPGDEDAALKGRPHQLLAATFPKVADLPADHDVERHDPGDSNQDDHDANRDRDADIQDPLAVEAPEDALQLQADQDKGENVQHEDGHVPHSIGGNAPSRIHAGRGSLCDGHRIDDDGDDRGNAKPIGEDPDGEGAEKLHQHIDRDVRPMRRHQGPESRQTPAERGATACGQQRYRQDMPTQCGASGRRADRDAVDQKRRGVVQQAFTFQNDQKAMWRPELTQHRRGGRGVRWCHNGP